MIFNLKKQWFDAIKSGDKRGGTMSAGKSNSIIINSNNSNAKEATK